MPVSGEPGLISQLTGGTRNLHIARETSAMRSLPPFTRRVNGIPGNLRQHPTIPAAEHGTARPGPSTLIGPMMSRPGISNRRDEGPGRSFRRRQVSPSVFKGSFGLHLPQIRSGSDEEILT